MFVLAAAVDDFYKTISGVSFTLLGLWFVVVQLKYKEGAGDPQRRRHVYGVTLFFLIPAVMAMLSSINTEMKMLWRVTFGITGALGLVEIVLYFATDGIRTKSASVLRMLAILVYIPIVLVALSPSLVDDVGIDLLPREVEAILLSAVIVIGVHLAFLALTESNETAGA